MSKELPEGHSISAHKDEVGKVMHRWKHHDPKPLHSGRGKGGKEGKVVKSQDQAIAIALSMAGKSKGKTSDHAERLMSMGYSEDVASEVSSMLDGTYDFTRCERPNGTAYGTAGKCRKGTESARVPFHQHEKATGATPMERALGKLKEVGRRINDPNYTPTEEEMLRYGKLKSAVEDMQNSKERKDKKVDLPRKTPAELEMALENHIKGKGTSSRDFKDALERMTEEIETRKEESRGLGKMFQDPLWKNAENQALERMEKTLDKATKVYEDRFGFSETNRTSESLDFTTCERPNGSRYGTGGKCRKGTEVSADEMSAIDQLAGMLPKGEKILDSSGKSHTAGGQKSSTAETTPKRRDEEDVRRPGGKMIGTSPRNMAIDGLADLKKEAEDYKKKFGSRAGEEMVGNVMKMYDERIKAQEQFIRDNYGND